MRFFRFGRFVAAMSLSAIVVVAVSGAAGAADISAARTIAVSGMGAASGAPTEARMSAGVATTAPTASAALAQNARKMTAVFDALGRLGVPPRAVQTSNFSVEPQYGPAGGAQRITGYQVSNQVDVTLDDADKLGPALDALVGAGANQINSVSYGIKDPSALQATAREAAVADAVKRAQTYAHAAGVTLGSIVSIQEGAAEMPAPMYRVMAFRAGASAPPTPTAAGELSVTATVSVVFELK
ncbi:MAG: SIMPL domain-containing protein [Rhizomicrobium sp.]